MDIENSVSMLCKGIEKLMTDSSNTDSAAVADDLAEAIEEICPSKTLDAGRLKRKFLKSGEAYSNVYSSPSTILAVIDHFVEAYNAGGYLSNNQLITACLKRCEKDERLSSADEKKYRADVEFLRKYFKVEIEEK